MQERYPPSGPSSAAQLLAGTSLTLEDAVSLRFGIGTSPYIETSPVGCYRFRLPLAPKQEENKQKIASK
jgi:hypothetical protein